MNALAVLTDHALDHLAPDSDAEVVGQAVRFVPPYDTVEIDGQPVPVLREVILCLAARDPQAEGAPLIVRPVNRRGACFEATTVEHAADKAILILSDLAEARGEEIGGTGIIVRELDRLDAIGLDLG